MLLGIPERERPVGIHKRKRRIILKSVLYQTGGSVANKYSWQKKSTNDGFRLLQTSRNILSSWQLSASQTRFRPKRLPLHLFSFTLRSLFRVFLNHFLFYLSPIMLPITDSSSHIPFVVFFLLFFSFPFPVALSNLCSTNITSLSNLTYLHTITQRFATPAVVLV